MATYYVDSTFTGTSDGSIAGPWKTIADATLADGDTLALKRGSVFREEITSAETAFNNITITAYGDGELPIVSGADIITSWTSVNGKIYSYSAGSNICGNVAEDNKAMVWRQWTTDLTTTNLSPGEFAFDPVGFVLYIYPSTDTPDAHVYEVSVRLYCLRSNQLKSGIVIENIHFKQASRHGLTMISRTNWVIQNCVFTLHGGYKEPSYYLGNAIEMSHSTDNGIGRNNVFINTFDSAITSQLFEGTADSLTNHTWENNIIKNVSLAGIEISTQTANQTITNITVRGNRITEVGFFGWLAKRTGTASYGIGIANNGGVTCIIDRINIYDNYVESQRYGITNASTTVSGTNVTIARNKLIGPRKYTDGGVQGIRLNGGTANIIANYIEGFTDGVNITGSASFVTTIVNSTFNANFRATFRDNPNATFNTKNCLFINQTDRVHSGNYTSGYTGQNNALWENAASGANYSSTGDIISDPQLYTDYTLKLNSPLIAAGVFSQYALDLNKILYNNPPSIGAYEYIDPRVVSNPRQAR